MNAASLFILRTYMYSMVDSFVASMHIRPSVTEPGNEGYCTCRIYPLKIFRRYAQTTKNLLHEKRTPENFTTRKFPNLRYKAFSCQVICNPLVLKFVQVVYNISLLKINCPACFHSITLTPHPQKSVINNALTACCTETVAAYLSTSALN